LVGRRCARRDWAGVAAVASATAAWRKRQPYKDAAWRKRQPYKDAAWRERQPYKDAAWRKRQPYKWAKKTR
jgi:hypothetical protein